VNRRFCLLLGYHDGFQIWDITHPDNVHEIVSIRDGNDAVSFLKVMIAFDFELRAVIVTTANTGPSP